MVLFQKIKRRKALEKIRSTVPTGIVPLSCIKTATVYVDKDSADWADASRRTQDFFEMKGIKSHVIAVSKLEIDKLGRRIKAENEPSIIGKEDLLISLVPYVSFAMEYEVLSSQAIFKIGRAQQKNNKIFNLVVSDNQIDFQVAIFDYIVDFIAKIQ